MLNGELLEFPKANYTEEDLARFRQEAWDWAVSEKDRFYPETKNINLKSLERHPHKYGAHLAIFLMIPSLYTIGSAISKRSDRSIRSWPITIF